MNIEFEHPWLLMLIWAVPVLVAWWVMLWKRTGDSLGRFIAPPLQAKLCPAHHRRHTVWQIAMVGTAILLAIIAAGRPKWGKSEQTLYTRGRDLIIALDVSRSMLANDVHPSRLQRAKTDILDLISELRGDRAGLLAFRQKAILLCPLTTDYAYLRQAVDAVDIDSAPRGETDIGDAVHKALDAFEDEQGAHRAIILISDGEDLSGRARVEAERAAEKGVVIFAVGLGAATGARIPDSENPGSYFSYKGSNIVTRLNHEVLYDMARITGGAYIPVATSGMAGTTLGTIYDNHLRRVAAQELEETLQSQLIERYQLFLLPALLLLMAACTLSRGRLRTTPGTARPARQTETGTAQLKDLSSPTHTLKALSLLFCLAATCTAIRAAETNTVSATNQTVDVAVEAGPGQRGRAGARTAQRYYRLGMYDKAAQAFLDAAQGSGRTLERHARFNAAVALYQAGEFEKAAGILAALDAQLLEPDPAVSVGLGSALNAQAEKEATDSAVGLEKKLKLMTSAAEAFKTAARKAESPTPAENLSVLLKELPKLETEARIARVNETHKDDGPFDLVAQMLTNQRSLGQELKRVSTNELPARIRALEALAKKQDENADLWIPLKGKLLSALAQQGESDEVQQQMARMAEGIELTRDSMRGTAQMLRDVRIEDPNATAVDENAVYGFWKMLASCAPIVNEALARQTNAIQQTTLGMTNASSPDAFSTALNDQVETRALTDLFIERFDMEFPEGVATQAPAMPPPGEGEQPAQPQLSEEDRAKIKRLAADASLKEESAFKLLTDGDPGRALVEAEASYALLKEIQELLPKQSQQQQGQQKQQDQQQDQQQQDQQQQDQQQDQQQQQSGDEQQQQAEQQEPKEQEGSETNALPENIRELLEKALEREQEHAAEKRRQNRTIPMLPHEKDW